MVDHQQCRACYNPVCQQEKDHKTLNKLQREAGPGNTSRAFVGGGCHPGVGHGAAHYLVAYGHVLSRFMRMPLMLRPAKGPGGTNRDTRVLPDIL